MTTIPLDSEWSLTLPDDYTPPPLPGRDEWCEALESGRYAAGKHDLCRDDRYCCLGVLTEIQGRLMLAGERWVDDGMSCALADSNPMMRHLDELGEFPKDVAAHKADAGSPTNLAYMNDISCPFPIIAKAIRLIWSDGGPLLK